MLGPDKRRTSRAIESGNEPPPLITLCRVLAGICKDKYIRDRIGPERLNAHAGPHSARHMCRHCTPP